LASFVNDAVLNRWLMMINPGAYLLFVHEAERRRLYQEMYRFANVCIDLRAANARQSDQAAVPSAGSRNSSIRELGASFTCLSVQMPAGSEQMWQLSLLSKYSSCFS
jgi:hypothetical protein